MQAKGKKKRMIEEAEIEVVLLPSINHHHFGVSSLAE
jgi:hypothetical protein